MVMMWTAIKKFGLQHSDLPTTLGNVAFMLRALALNIDSRNKTPIPWFVYLACLVIASSYFFVYLISVVWFVTVWYPRSGDLLTTLIIFSLGVSSEIGTVKLVFMFVHINKVREIVAETLACDAAVVPESRFSRNILSTMREVKKRAMVFWLVIIFNGVVYVIKPILLPGRHLMEDKFILFGLEPMYETPNYQISYLLMLAGVTFTCYLPANITAFLIVVAGYVEAQMLALTEELLHLRNDAEEYYHNMKSAINVLNENRSRDGSAYTKHELINKYVEAHLKNIIKHHARNINLLHQIEDVFTGAIAMEFFVLIIAFIAELLGGLENTYLEMPFAMIQVGMDCFTGQRVMDANVHFERAVYGCKWEEYDRENMKTVLVMLQNAQKTMKLSAGGLTMLSFNCLMLVNRSIYSAYTTLRTMVK